MSDADNAACKACFYSDTQICKEHKAQIERTNALLWADTDFESLTQAQYVERYR